MSRLYLKRCFFSWAFGWTCLFVLTLPVWSQSRELPRALSDGEFWRLVTELSETGGRFQPQLRTNEDSLQFVIPALIESCSDGVYIGVGTEQKVGSR